MRVTGHIHINVSCIFRFPGEPSPPDELQLIDHAVTSTSLTALFKVSLEGQDDVTGYILRAVSTDSKIDSKMEIKLQPTGRLVSIKHCRSLLVGVFVQCNMILLICRIL